MFCSSLLSLAQAEILTRALGTIAQYLDIDDKADIVCLFSSQRHMWLLNMITESFPIPPAFDDQRHRSMR